MSKFIKREDYLKNVERIYPLKEPQKKTTKFSNEHFRKSSIKHYRTSFEVSYLLFTCSLSRDIIAESEHDDEDTSFIIFNNSSSNSELKDKKTNKTFIFKNKHFVVGKIKKDFKAVNKYFANKEYCVHYILLKDSLLQELLKIDLNNEALFEVNGFKITSEIVINNKQKLILNNLLNLFPLEGKLQELYLESKLIDLLYISMNEIKNYTLKDSFSLNSKDIECLYKAKEILIKNISNPPSLKILAHKSAINEFKLKKGFKRLFNNTVFGFLQEYRLQEAKKILLGNEININEVANLVGYKNVSHFSKIFKKYFGENPIEIKKNQKKVYV